LNKNRLIKYTSIITLIIFFFVLYNQYEISSKAKNIHLKLEQYCAQYSLLPDNEKFKSILLEEKVKNPKQWYLFLGKTKKAATLQYPLSFWSPFSIGKAKLSEFIPLPYSHTAKVSCPK
jgi:hypothetical protein